MKAVGKYFNVPFEGIITDQRLGGQEMDIRFTYVKLDNPIIAHGRTISSICLEERTKDPKWMKEQNFLEGGV